MADSKAAIEVVVCGLATVDIVVRPVSLDHAVGPGRLVETNQIEATTGGIVSNSGIALSRLGIRTAAIACVGNDLWADLIRQRFVIEQIDATGLMPHATEATSVTVVLVDSNGQRSFIFCPGAAPNLTSEHVLQQDIVRDAKWILFGYFSLFPEFDLLLPDLLRQVRAAGCRTALDCAGSGGSGEKLRQLLPYLDLYVPSFDEAVCQTGLTEPRKILRQFREWGATQVIGLKLGAQGALLSPAPNEYFEIPAIHPRQPVVDTTGAGDAFYAGLIAALVRGKCLQEAGLIAAATGAACVTALGASAGLLTWDATCELAGVSDQRQKT